MSKLLSITFNDLRVFFSQPVGVFINLIAIPVALVFFIGFANGGFNRTDTPRLRVDVIDNDNSALSQQVLADVRAVNSTLVLCPMDNTDDDFCGLGDSALTEELAQQRILDDTSLGLIIIPANFQADVQAGNEVRLIYRSQEEAGSESAVQQAVQSVTQRLSAVLVAERVGLDVADSLDILQFSDDEERAEFGQQIFERAQTAWAQEPIRVDYRLSATTTSGNAQQIGFGQSATGTGSMYVMFTVLGGIVALIEERKNWTLQRLVMMPVARWQILGGKMLSRFIMGVIQYGVTFGAGLFFGVNYGDELLAIALVALSFVACITALTFLLATMVRSVEQASGVSLFIVMTMAPLGGAWWPLEIVPDFMRTIGHISPIAWAMDGFRALLYANGTLVDVLPSIAVLSGAAVVLFVVAVQRFKYE
jgi:ABC-2 type transport system permease protein